MRESGEGREGRRVRGESFLILFSLSERGREGGRNLRFLVFPLPPPPTTTTNDLFALRLARSSTKNQQCTRHEFGKRKKFAHKGKRVPIFALVLCGVCFGETHAVLAGMWM